MGVLQTTRGFTRILLIFSLVVLTSCAKEAAEEPLKSIEEIAEMGGQINLAKNEDGTLNNLQGTGWVRFLRTMVTTTDSAGAEFGINLLEADSSVALVFYSSSLDMSNGIKFVLERSGASIISKIVKPNGTIINIPAQKLTGFVPNNFEGNLDLHAWQDRARTLFWEKGITMNVSTARIDSSRIGDASAPLDQMSLTGLYVGLVIKKAQVFKISLSAPKLDRSSLTP